MMIIHATIERKIVIAAKQTTQFEVMRIFLIACFTFLFFETYCQVSLTYAPVKKKFVYAGVDNPVILDGVNELSRPIVSVLRASIRRCEDQLYYINPQETDSCKIVVRDELGTQIIFSIAVRPTPEPDPFLNSTTGSGTFTCAEIQATDSLVLAIRNFDWSIMFSIDSFQVTRISALSKVSL